MSVAAEQSARLRPVDQVIASNVRVELARQRRSAADLGRAVGIPERPFRYRTRGEMPFTVGELVAVADALGVPVAALVAE